MTRLNPAKRRPEFDEIADGWGVDGAEDLRARMDLLRQRFTALSGFTAAEVKVETAMRKRLGELEARSWYDRGFEDGFLGRSALPAANAGSRDDYLQGYAAGTGKAAAP